MRIISLLPSATEVLFAIGAGDNVVGVTHECDFPEAACDLPNCTVSLLPEGLSASEIDEAVSHSLKGDPHSIYALKTDTIRELHPTLIVTQSLCAVCAVPQETVEAVVCTLPSSCTVVAADPHTLDDLFDSICVIGRAVNRADAAQTLVTSLKHRLKMVTNRICEAPVIVPPSVAVLEWPDPVFAPGHWVPDQITAAGGKCVLGSAGSPSCRISWKELHPIFVDVIVCAFCGYNLIENQRQVDLLSSNKDWIKFSAGKLLFATDASAFFSRPGNRLIDGIELLAFIIHRTEQYRPKRGRGSFRRGNTWVDLSELDMNINET